MLSTSRAVSTADPSASAETHATSGPRWARPAARAPLRPDGNACEDPGSDIPDAHGVGQAGTADLARDLHDPVPRLDQPLIAHDAITPLGLVEDELILLIPPVPVNPALSNTESPGVWQARAPEKAHPFATLGSLLKTKPS